MTPSAQSVHDLLESVQDSRELVVRRRDDGVPLLGAWRGAAQDARDAYARWQGAPGPLTHAAYLAAEDQADASLASLAA